MVIECIYLTFTSFSSTSSYIATLRPYYESYNNEAMSVHSLKLINGQEILNTTHNLSLKLEWPAL